MQIVDVNALWVRVVVVTLKRRDSPLTFELFPMIHLGSPEYYEIVRTQVEECDLAVVEGVGRSLQGSLLTMTYRVTRLARRSGLVVQPLGPKSFDIPVINPDLTRGEFRQGWRRLPWRHRVQLWLMVPVFAVAMLVIGPRRMVAMMGSTDDEPTLADLNAAATMPELDALLVDTRDRLLVEALVKLHEERSHEPIRVAVVYGAGHIPAVVHSLSRRYRYIARDGRFVTVFDL